MEVIPYVDKKGYAREKAGRLRLAIIQNADEETIGSFLNKNVEPGSEIRSDGWRGYSKTAMKGYDHDKRIVGSGMTIDGTGILLHNRGRDFSLDLDHPNCLKPHKRPYHTLSPAMVFKGVQPCMVLGSPGADGQTQTLIQIFLNLVEFGVDIQEAIEIPRWRSSPRNHLYIEARFPSTVQEGLKAKGHR